MMFRTAACHVSFSCAAWFVLLLQPAVAQDKGQANEGAKQPPQIDAAEADAATRKHLQAIALAMHVYVDHHQGVLPPAAVDNPALPPEKRLSGLVLLLPYLGEKPGYLDDATWNVVRIDPQQAAAAKALFESIDLSKSWDDPVNAKAARTVVPAFLSPEQEANRDQHGYAVSHFAFVRGYAAGEDGAFPLGTKVAIYDPEGKKDSIADGTAATIGLGQINDRLGPWIAAGTSTSRHLFHPSEAASFGSPHKGACYFAKCDGSVAFIDLQNSTPAGLGALATRSGRDENLFKGNVRSYRSAEEWQLANEGK